MNRREALRTLAAGSAAGALTAGIVISTTPSAFAVAPTAEAPIADPALAVLTTYRQQIDAFNKDTRGLSDDDLDALRDRTWGPFWNEVEDDPSKMPAATTYAGAILALQTMLTEQNLDGFDEGLLRSALAYFEGRA